jgi:hypothetical protein
MALPAHSGVSPLTRSRNHISQTAGLLGRVISPSQGRYINTEQHKHRINAYTHTPNIHALSWIRTHDPSARSREDSWRLRPRSYCDRQINTIIILNNIRSSMLFKIKQCADSLRRRVSRIEITKWAKITITARKYYAWIDSFLNCSTGS